MEGLSNSRICHYQVKHPFDEKLYLAFIDDVFDEKCKVSELITFARYQYKLVVNAHWCKCAMEIFKFLLIFVYNVYLYL